MIEPKVGDIITVGGIKYRTELSLDPNKRCEKCHLLNVQCIHIDCSAYCRNDNQAVIFKKVKEMEVKIQIPDNCELIKDGDTYIVKEKKQEPPRSWEEFCEKYPKKMGESFISSTSEIFAYNTPSIRDEKRDKNVCPSKEETEAFLAFMQLRQLRKAWVGDWEPIKGETYLAIYNDIAEGICDSPFSMSNTAMSFPTPKMSEDFLSCFKDLCETAKILL